MEQKLTPEEREALRTLRTAMEQAQKPSKEDPAEIRQRLHKAIQEADPEKIHYLKIILENLSYLLIKCKELEVQEA